MKPGTPTLSVAERRQRNLAALLLLGAFMMFIVMLHQLWWMPWSQARARSLQLAERHTRVQGLIAQRASIQAALSRAEDAARQQPLWQPHPSAAQALDDISSQLEQAVNMAGGNANRCKLLSRNPAPAEAGQNTAGQVTLAVRLRCGNAELLQLLHLLESSQPVLLLDGLNISGPPHYPGAIITGASGVLEVGFNVSGFVHRNDGGQTP